MNSLEIYQNEYPKTSFSHLLKYGEIKESHVFTIDNTIALKKKRSQFVKYCAAEATILSSKSKYFFGVDFAFNALRNELLLCLCAMTFVFNIF